MKPVQIYSLWRQKLSPTLFYIQTRYPFLEKTYYRIKKCCVYIWHHNIWAVILVALVLRLNGLGSRDLWYDEVLGVIQSLKSFITITKEVPTPIHYYFVHIFSYLGINSFVLGLPSVIFGVLSVFILYKLINKYFNASLAFIVSFLLAISPMHAEFSQQILFFSYYVFFSLLSIYLALDLVDALSKEVFKWKSFWLLFLVCVLNVLTQMVALAVCAVIALYLAIYFALYFKVVFKATYKYLPLFILLSLGLIHLILNVGSGGYANLFKNLLVVGTKTPLTVGYSLSYRQGTNILSYNSEFFTLMFSWLGIGYGIRFYIYLTFAIIGLFYMAVRKNFRILTILILLLVVPFIILYFVRMTHWFEEKYFIFMLPVYLVFVGCGIYVIAKTAATIISKFLHFKVAWAIGVLLVAIVLLTIQPMRDRTSFGFTFPDHVHYNWQGVYSWLKENRKPDQPVYLMRSGSLFLDYYFGFPEKNTITKDETTVPLMSSQEYMDLVNSGNHSYFVTNVDYPFMYLYPITKSKLVKQTGGFGIYKISFKKRVPIEVAYSLLKGTPRSSWSYIEDFRSANYLAEAVQWENIVASYAYLPNTKVYDYYSGLYPKSPADAYIDYQFILPDLAPINLQTHQFLTEGTSFRILAGSGPANLQEIYSTTAKNTFWYSSDVKYFPQGRNTYIRLMFPNEGNADFSNKVFLDLFSVSSGYTYGAYDDAFVFDTSNPGETFYSYNAALEPDKETKWYFHTVEKAGWTQTLEGYLIKLYGQSPLTYKFVPGIEFTRLSIDVKAMGAPTNPIKVSYSTDNIHWNQLDVFDEGIPLLKTYTIENIKTYTLFLKFELESEVLDTGFKSPLRSVLLKIPAPSKGN